jgi:hypothetical protein
MQEILPGIFHWTEAHPKIGIHVSSYYFAPEQALIDPLIPEEGLEWFADRPPENIYLSIRHHYRHCAEFAERFGCEVWCVEEGLHEFVHGEAVRGFRFGDILPGDVKTIEIGSICSDEGALYIEREGGCVVLADGCIRMDEGPLQFVPDALLGDNPAKVKDGLKRAYRRLLQAYSFDHVLLSHGGPLINDGREKLIEFSNMSE